MEIDDITYRKITCEGCGLDLVDEEVEQTEIDTELSDSLVFAGDNGNQRVSAIICPECNAENPL